MYDDDDNLLVNDFVNKVSHSIVYSHNHDNIGFPEERLAALIEENASMKVELETKLEKIKHYKFIVDEYKRALDDEIKKSN
jgi:hypothetical protein